MGEDAAPIHAEQQYTIKQLMKLCFQHKFGLKKPKVIFTPVSFRCLVQSSLQNKIFISISWKEATAPSSIRYRDQKKLSSRF